MVLVVVLLILILGWGLFYGRINNSLAVHFLLNSQNPTEEAFEDTAARSMAPATFLNRCWATGKVTHRRLVATYLRDIAATNSPWFPDAEPLLLAGAIDADASVRELALATLEQRHSPRLFDLAVRQLDDLDPMVRLLGLDYLRRTDPQRAVPVVMRLLDDSDLRVVTSAEGALMRWSEVDFGVRTHLSIALNAEGHLDVPQAEIIRQGVERRKEWWKLHAEDYPHPSVQADSAELRTITRAPLDDFALKDLEGRKVRLSQFRGKVVLLNFWATWCTACLTEIPDLIALQNKLGARVSVVGIALDGTADEHDDEPAENSSKRAEVLRLAHAKILRVVKARGINYTVLWDANNSVGGRFNGGELPTTVIIDAEGRMYRRFIGGRSLGVFEQMVAEAAKGADTKR